MKNWANPEKDETKRLSITIVSYRKLSDKGIELQTLYRQPFSPYRKSGATLITVLSVGPNLSITSMICIKPLECNDNLPWFQISSFWANPGTGCHVHKVDKRRGGERIDAANQALFTLETLGHPSQPNYETDHHTIGNRRVAKKCSMLVTWFSSEFLINRMVSACAHHT